MPPRHRRCSLTDLRPSHRPAPLPGRRRTTTRTPTTPRQTQHPPAPPSRTHHRVTPHRHPAVPRSARRPPRHHARPRPLRPRTGRRHPARRPARRRRQNRAPVPCATCWTACSATSQPSSPSSRWPPARTCAALGGPRRWRHGRRGAGHKPQLIPASHRDQNRCLRTSGPEGGASDRSRTRDILITSEALYQLSYGGVRQGRRAIVSVPLPAGSGDSLGRRRRRR